MPEQRGNVARTQLGADPIDGLIGKTGLSFTPFSNLRH
jgi:hypothetical protein